MLWRVQVEHFSHCGHMLRLGETFVSLLLRFLLFCPYLPTALPHTSVATEFWSRVRRP